MTIEDVEGYLKPGKGGRLTTCKNLMVIKWQYNEIIMGDYGIYKQQYAVRVNGDLHRMAALMGRMV